MDWLLLIAVGIATEVFYVVKKTPYFDIVCICMHVYTCVHMGADTYINVCMCVYI